MADVVALLREHAPFEAEAAALYQRLWIWADKLGLKGAAAYFKASHREERHHLQAVLDYVNDYFDILLPVPAVAENTDSFISLQRAVNTALQAELRMSDRLNRLYFMVDSAQDYITCASLLRGLLEEQAKSVSELRTIEKWLSEASTNYAAILSVDEKMKHLV